MILSRHKLIALAREHAPNEILIEQAGPGLHLVQELRAKPEAGVHVPPLTGRGTISTDTPPTAIPSNYPACRGIAIKWRDMW